MNEIRTVACIGDSITFAPSMAIFGVTEPWVDQLTAALERTARPRRGDGFRGLWRDDEWAQSGSWTQPETADPFDVAPFRRGLYSSGCAADELVWIKPATLTVHAFDIYSFPVPGAGGWQYRVDDGPWSDIPEPRAVNHDKIHRHSVDQPVGQQVTIRGHDGSAPRVAPVMGIETFSTSTEGVVVHNLGHQLQTLTQFCRASAGDPLALLDELRPDLVVVMFSNDVLFRNPDRFAHAIEALVARVAPYADVLLMTPFEQRTDRCVDDALTTAGSTELISPSALFTVTDEGKSIHGTNIAIGTQIRRVHSVERVTMTAAATGASSHGELMVASKRDRALQASYRAVTRATAEALGCPMLDLADAWQASVGAGWDAAYAAGLMSDGLHPNQNGHDDIAKRVIEALGL